MKLISSLTVFFPAFNDAKILPYLIAKMYDLIPHLTDDFEVIIVDDGSTDETPLLTKILAKHYRNLKVIRHQKNMGYGGAVRSGLKNATKNWIFYTDGDGQYDPYELKKLVAKLKPGIDVVNGYKLNRQDSLIRKILSICYHFISHTIYKLPISDIDCDFRLIRGSFIKEIKLTSSSGLICLELIIKLQQAGAHFVQAPVNHHARLIGKSEFFRPKHLWDILKEYIVFLYEVKAKRL